MLLLPLPATLLKSTLSFKLGRSPCSNGKAILLPPQSNPLPFVNNSEGFATFMAFAPENGWSNVVLGDNLSSGRPLKSD